MSGLTWDMIDVHKGAPGQCPPGSVLMYMHVCARDRARGMLFLGGLGSLRVGHMWQVDRPGELDEYPGYDDAPERECPPFYRWPPESDTPTDPGA
jgi:hypothetical protein